MPGSDWVIAAGLGSDSWEVIINNVGLVACDFILEQRAGHGYNGKCFIFNLRLNRGLQGLKQDEMVKSKLKKCCNLFKNWKLSYNTHLKNVNWSVIYDEKLYLIWKLTTQNTNRFVKLHFIYLVKGNIFLLERRTMTFRDQKIFISYSSQFLNCFCNSHDLIHKIFNSIGHC